MPDRHRHDPLAGCRQALRVIAEGWDSTSGMLQAFARTTPSAAWRAEGSPIAVRLGRAGLAWGIGLHPESTAPAPHKQEGDGRAPAGIFAIPRLFGETGEHSALARSFRLPYLGTHPDLLCIDDPESRHYNRIIDRRITPDADWGSCETLLRDDTRYALAAVIAHNANPPLAGAGSCIFLHVWQDEYTPTAGCTAAPLAEITRLLGWLDPAASPCLVQLPETEYLRHKDSWQLP